MTAFPIPPKCPGCHLPLELRGTRMPADGVSYEVYVISCRKCGHPISTLWHPEMLEHFAGRMVDIVLEDLVTPPDGADITIAHDIRMESNEREPRQD